MNSISSRVWKSKKESSLKIRVREQQETIGKLGRSMVIIAHCVKELELYLQ